MSNAQRFAKMKARMKSLAFVFSGGSVFFIGLNLYKGNEKFYRDFVMPLVGYTDPETAHCLAVKAAKYGFIPRSNMKESSVLTTNLWGLKFKNPIGVAAGFDKHCEAASGLFKAGFSHVETGTVTPKPQPGNAKPRVFRLTEDEAVINRYGFNSVGHEEFSKNFELVLRNSNNGIIGVSIGKNKDSQDAIQDYVDGVKKFGCTADYIAINVSSPNTPGLRNLQKQESLEELIKIVISTRNSLDCSKKALVFVKISPDMEKNDLKNIAKVLTKYKVDGVIISNTTITRPEYLISDNKKETGGLSGQPVKSISTKAIHDMYAITNGKMPIIGVGGIASGADAYSKIKAGASLLQLYTAMVYQGPAVVNRINEELLELLRSDGFNNIGEAVGADHHP